MDASDSTLKQRKPKTQPGAANVIVPDHQVKPAKPSSSWSILDILRVLGGALLLSGSLSYFVLGDSFTWGYDPKWAKWQSIRSLWTPPLSLTKEQLSLYNGTDPTLPIYLSINNTIYDVTAGRKKYGPGGSYSFFAGRDASRAFVTGCFKEDLTNDLRGVEDMFEGDVDDPMMEVWKKVHHWAQFFDKHKEYFKVGKLVQEDLTGVPWRPLCAQAGGKVKRHLGDQKRNFEAQKKKSSGQTRNREG